MEKSVLTRYLVVVRKNTLKLKLKAHIIRYITNNPANKDSK